MLSFFRINTIRLDNLSKYFLKPLNVCSLVTFCLQLCWATVKLQEIMILTSSMNIKPTMRRAHSVLNEINQFRSSQNPLFLCHFSRSVDEWQISPCWNVPEHLLYNSPRLRPDKLRAHAVWRNVCDSENMQIIQLRQSFTNNYPWAFCAAKTH